MTTFYCSFCGKSQHDVRKLIAGPKCFICDECVDLCVDIIREDNQNSFVPRLSEDDVRRIVREEITAKAG